jgi:hypothetical protein
MQDTQWEYLVLRSRGTDPCVSTLNAKGQEGWEAVGCYALKVQEDTRYWYEWCVLLKRPKRP